MSHILVIGGAGYIGSHMVQLLLQQGHQVTTLDNLSRGHLDAVVGGEFALGNLGDDAVLNDLFSTTRFDAVMHFAAFIEVGESVREPAMYYDNNTRRTITLLDAMVRHQIPNFIFSSTAAIFGEPVRTPIDESHPKDPINPYGRSKLMVEQILQDYEQAYGLQSVSLRYFNAAGADPEGRLGERHDPETHLIPLVLQAASGRRPNISVFGRDYDTHDGTCVRDYIHIIDLCQAHIRAMEWLQAGKGSNAFNLGNGNGFSVQQVIDAAKQVTGNDFNVVDAERRPGDPAVLVADATRARKLLGWAPAYDSLETIIEHAWQWETTFFGSDVQAGKKARREE
jgi:UDP-glucose 4-epimerase